MTVEQIQQELAQTHQKLRENTTSQGEIRQQLKQDADNRQQQQTLLQQIAQMTQQVEGLGYSVARSSTGEISEVCQVTRRDNQFIPAIRHVS